jgi:hypothetical protein
LVDPALLLLDFNSNVRLPLGNVSGRFPDWQVAESQHPQQLGIRNLRKLESDGCVARGFRARRDSNSILVTDRAKVRQNF